MQDLDIRYVMILIPIIYVILPYIFVGDLSYFTVVTITTVLTSIGVTWALTSFELVGSGFNQEGTYQAFVLVTGLIFYGLSFVLSFLGSVPLSQWNIYTNTPVNNYNPNYNGNKTSINNIFTSTPQNICYPINILKINGVGFFALLDVVMGIVLILGLYFMISSRGH